MTKQTILPPAPSADILAAARISVEEMEVDLISTLPPPATPTVKVEIQFDESDVIPWLSTTRPGRGMRTVTLATDGLVDYIETPEGQRYTLGPVSVLKVVSTFVQGRGRQRRALEEFNATGEVMVSLDLDALLASLVPTRRRWAASPLIPAVDRTMDPAKHIATQITAAEQHLGRIAHGMKAGQKPGADLLKGLHKLVASIHLPNFGDQSKNDAFMGLGQPKVDTVPDGGFTPPRSVTHPTPGKEASLATFDRNVALAEDTLGKIQAVDARITQIEASRKASGKGGFNAARARADVHVLSNRLTRLASECDMAQPWVGTELDKLAEDTAKIHDVFFPAPSSGS